jgi:transcriptional regulator with XRE-family HTH domain
METRRTTRTHQEVLDSLLADDELRAAWEETTVARAVANQVIRYRAEHGLSQREVAAKLGVSHALVGRLELGEHEPRLRTLQLLSRRLGIRFNIDIHPTGATSRLSADDPNVERATSQGVETLVCAVMG